MWAVPSGALLPDAALVILRGIGLVGREAEIRLLGEMLGSAGHGSSAVVVLVGEAGVGKTALIDGVVSAAADFEVLRIAGVESEAELGYAGLHRLLLPLLPYVDDLPVQQRDALRGALGLAEGDASRRFLVGLGALTLLSERALDRPILCIIDDAQWVDGESLDLFAFVARRLLADRIAIVFASRSGQGSLTSLAGLPSLEVGGLGDAAARLLLSQHADGVLTDSVTERVVEETGGNPLALIELCHEASGGRAEPPCPQARAAARRRRDRTALRAQDPGPAADDTDVAARGRS